MSLRFLALILSVLCAVVASRSAVADDKLTLPSDDRKLLDDLFKEFLFDPTGIQRVSLEIDVRTAWAHTQKDTVEGWFVAGNEHLPGRVYFADGLYLSVSPEKELTKIDFEPSCKDRYDALEKKSDDRDSDEAFRQMRRTAVGAVEPNDLALAAWLHRRGHDDLAARALAVARSSQGEPKQRLRSALAWSAFAKMVHAYMVRADEEAQVHGERLLRAFNAEAHAEFSQAFEIVDELNRRQARGTFGKTPPETWPDGFDTWDTAKKAAYLIAALDEVDARQGGQPGGVDLASDRRVEALIQMGDEVVPQLLDVMDTDTRLTRSVHFWRDFSTDRTVLSVREAALTAIMSILRVQIFDPASTGDNFTIRGEQAAQEMSKRLRTYWTEYGALPFDERMMKVLTDPGTKFEAKREAARNLATLNGNVRLGTTVWSGHLETPVEGKPNQATAKFANPAVPEAILIALDADLKDHDAKPADHLHDWHRRHIEDNYLQPLIELGDRRIAGELARRSEAAPTVRMRRKWAYAAHRLGQPATFERYIEAFRAGNIKLPANDEPNTNGNDQPGNVELVEAIADIASVATPEANHALMAVADPSHPYYRLAAERVIYDSVSWSSNTPWFAHAYCLSILRREMDNVEPTSVVMKIVDDTVLQEDKKGGSSSAGIPRFLEDPAVRRNEATLRACDAAAEKVGQLVIGLPPYHPLFKNADARLASVKEVFDRFVPTFRRATRRECRVLGASSFDPSYVPEIPPLGRAATAEDVEAGHAIFHLEGRGKPADVSLPRVGLLISDKDREYPPRHLIVQAEVDAEGQVTYGAISRNALRPIPAAEFASVRTFDEIEEEWRKAAEEHQRQWKR